ncbi:MAG: hypothetical protein R2880_07995 [Deinococcales bacterium]
MTGYLNGSSSPLSRISAASLTDMGYVVNLNAADSYSIPGCSPNCLYGDMMHGLNIGAREVVLGSHRRS